MKPTVSYIRKMHAYLRARRRDAGDKGVLAVGIGWPMKEGKPDPARQGPVLVYAVHKKLSKVRREHFIDRVERVPAPGKSKKRRHTTMITDVVELGDSVLTGLKASSVGDLFTAGVLVAWDMSGSLGAGILSVGHAVPAALGSPIAVRVGAETIAGRLVRRTMPPAWLDVSLIQLNPDQLMNSPLAPFYERTMAMPVRSITDLVNEANVTKPVGFSLTAAGPRPFRYYAYFPGQTPERPVIPEAPQLRDLLVARGSDYEFEPGTSGSAWCTTNNIIDAIQVAAHSANDADGTLHPFYAGIAQPLEPSVEWARGITGPSLRVVGVI